MGKILSPKFYRAILQKIISHYVAIIGMFTISLLTSIFTLNGAGDSTKVMSVTGLERHHNINRSMRSIVKSCGTSSYVSWLRIEKQYSSSIAKTLYKAFKVDTDNFLYTGTFQGVVGHVTATDVTDVKYLNDIYQDSWVFDDASSKIILSQQEGDIITVSYEEALKEGYLTIAELMGRTTKHIKQVHLTPVYYDSEIIWIFTLAFEDPLASTCRDGESQLRQLAKLARRKVLEG